MVDASEELCGVSPVLEWGRVQQVNCLSRTGIGRHRVITATTISLSRFCSLLVILDPNSSSMPMFQNSQHTDAHGSTFNDVGRDQINADQVNIGPIIHPNSAGVL